MEQIDRINKIIQQFLDSKGDYSYLKPITHIDRCYGVDRKFGFNPTDGKFESYDAPSQFKDESERIKFIKKLNQDITKYNETIDIIQHPEIDLFPIYSFLVVREGNPYVDRRLYVEIHDELLYGYIQDEDFVQRFNKTIYEFLKYKKEELEAEGRWSDKNIYFKPFQAFGDWFDRHPQDTDAESYFEEIADCDIGVSIDGEHRNAVQMVKKSTKPKPPHKPKPPTPLSGEDFNSNWECAMYVRKRIVTGDGFSKDTRVYTGYDWAVEHCTVDEKPIEHRNKLINGYDNGKRKNKSAVIIGKFEEDYYD